VRRFVVPNRAAWFFLEPRKLRSELTQSRVARTRAEQREKELQGLLAEQQGRKRFYDVFHSLDR